jgi:hypothetical protein
MKKYLVEVIIFDLSKYVLSYDKIIISNSST